MEHSPPPRVENQATQYLLLSSFGGGGAEVVDAAGFDVLVFPRLVPVVVVAGVAVVCPTIACAAAAAATCSSSTSGCTQTSKGR